MRRSRKALALAIPVALVGAGMGLAEEVKKEEPKKEEAAPPKPAAELGQLKFFVGSWTSEGKAFANPFGPEHPVMGTVTVKPDLGGYWYAVSYDEKKTKENPMPFHFHGFWGYDAGSKQFVAVGVDGMGGWWTQTSPGWEGEKMVWTGEGTMNGQKWKGRDTFEKKGDGELSHVGEMAGADGAWSKMDEETCRKAVAKAAEPKKEGEKPAKP